MLSLLGNLEYTLIWPDSWEDVGFTEREIWINRQGYGYIMCDESTDDDCERDWADNSWRDMDNELLSEWIDRLSVIGVPSIIARANDRDLNGSVEKLHEENENEKRENTISKLGFHSS